LTRYYNIYYTK